MELLICSRKVELGYMHYLKHSSLGPRELQPRGCFPHDDSATPCPSLNEPVRQPGRAASSSQSCIYRTSDVDETTVS